MVIKSGSTAVIQDCTATTPYHRVSAEAISVAAAVVAWTRRHRLTGAIEQRIEGLPVQAREVLLNGPIVRLQSVGARLPLEVMAQLGENRAEAVQWIDRVLADQPDITEPQVLIAEVFRIRSGV